MKVGIRGEYGTAGENTIDKVFLLSVRDITNSDYGFKADPLKSGSSTRRTVNWTDYGVYVGGFKYDSNYGSDWLLRSPMYRKQARAIRKKISILCCVSITEEHVVRSDRRNMRQQVLFPRYG